MTKRSAIICDIDGTLAHMGDRSPYDPTLYHEDTLDETIASLLDILSEHYSVLIVSGRYDTYEDITAKWLDKYDVQYHRLFMRPEGDNRQDALIKKEIYEKYIRDEYEVLFVLDDRNRVVEQWRKLGLTCLQVADGDF